MQGMTTRRDVRSSRRENVDCMIELSNNKAQLYGAELGQCKGGSTTQLWDIKANVGVSSGTLLTCVYLGTLGHLKHHCTARFWEIAVGCTLWQRALRQQSF